MSAANILAIFRRREKSFRISAITIPKNFSGSELILTRNTYGKNGKNFILPVFDVKVKIKAFLHSNNEADKILPSFSCFSAAFVRCHYAENKRRKQHTYEDCCFINHIAVGVRRVKKQ